MRCAADLLDRFLKKSKELKKQVLLAYESRLFGGVVGLGAEAWDLVFHNASQV